MTALLVVEPQGSTVEMLNCGQLPGQLLTETG